MSRNTLQLQTSNQAFITTDLSKIFIWNNRYNSGTFEYSNLSSGDDVTVVAGTVLGRVASTGVLVVLDPAASDGSQYPVGILAQDVAILYGEEYSGEVDFCVAGDVAQEMVALPEGYDLDSVISAKTIADRIGSDTVGIKLVAGTENTENDNL